MWRFGSDANVVIHSGQLLDVTILDGPHVRSPNLVNPRGPQTFHYEIAAEGLPVRHGEETLTPFPLEDTAEATRGEG